MFVLIFIKGVNLNLKLRFDRNIMFWARSESTSRQISFTLSSTSIINRFTDLSMKRTGIMESPNFSKFWGGLYSELFYQGFSMFDTCRTVERIK